MKKIIFLLSFICVSLLAQSQINYYEVADKGYLRMPIEVKDGIVMSNNRFTEIYLLRNGELSTLVESRGCGQYVKVNKDKTLVGFKSINDQYKQAPALLDVQTGEVTLLEDYTNQCGQVSFSDNGAIAYTMGNNLVVCRGQEKERFDLGFYTNLTSISPDGTEVAFSNIDGQMFVIDLNTGAVQTLNVSNSYNPIWSPDGKKLAIQKINGELFVHERESRTNFDLGIGQSASWTENSEEVIFTSIERKHEFEVYGTSIKKAHFSGSNVTTLVASSEDCPMDAIMTSDNRLLISYTAGTARGLKSREVEIVKPSSTKVTTMSVGSKASEKTLYSIQDGVDFGKRFRENKATKSEIKNDKSEVKSQAPASRALGVDVIPYINQVWDVPSSYNGCYDYGYVACAPSSACMCLGYYGLLEPYALTSDRPGSPTVYYSWYVGRDYTSPITGYSFTDRADSYTMGCYNVGGGYGYMWSGDRGPATHMASFYLNNGCKSAYFDYTGWSTFVSETANNRPYSMCIANGTSGGHVLLGFQTNCDANGNYYYGSFVCHDPYGDYNQWSYPNYDGMNSTYDWPGYSNGHANVGSFYWGCVAIADVQVQSPYIEVSNNNVSLTCEAGKSVSTQVKVKGNRLNGWCYITVDDPDGVFSVSPTGLTVDGAPNYNFVDKEPIVTITFSSKKAGTYPADIDPSNSWNERIVTFKSVDVDGNDVYQWISLSGVATEPTSTEPGTTITPATDVVTGLTEVWNYSQKSGVTADWITNGSQVTQDMAFANGKLYVVHRNGGNADNKIYVVNAYNGSQIGTLDVSPCTTGTYLLSSVETIGGKVIASNLAASATSVLNVYLWDNDTSTPTTLLSTTSHGGARAGDAMSVSGDLSNGRIWFAYGSKVYYYTISNGSVLSSEPSVINLTKNGSEYDIAGTSASPNITVESDGSFWVSTKDNVSAHFTAAGAWIEDLSLDVIGNKQGTDLKILHLGSKKYIAATKYLNTTDASGGLTDATFMLMDVTNGVASATSIGTYPQAGLGTSRNVSYRNTLCTDIDERNLNIWVLTPFQGAAYYKFQHSSTVGVEDITNNGADFGVRVDAFNIEINGVDVADVEIYSVTGTLVAKDADANVNISSLASGVYIVKVTDVTGYVYTAKIYL